MLSASEKQITKYLPFDVSCLSRHEVNMALKAAFKLTVFDGYNIMMKNGSVTALLTHTIVNLCAKFEVSSLNRSRDIRESQNSKSGSRDPT